MLIQILSSDFERNMADINKTNTMTKFLSGNRLYAGDNDRLLLAMNSEIHKNRPIDFADRNDVIVRFVQNMYTEMNVTEYECLWNILFSTLKDAHSIVKST